MEGPKDLRKKLPYSPQLDGLRGICVLAVIFFHLRFQWADGGYLGVEAFFVISGFLITSLLLHEFAFRRRINLKEFWKRRARRLLPILFVVLGVTVILSLILARDYLGQLKGDVAAALAYITNWHLVLDDQSYFQAIERQSPLLHLWSLAIEEQFYLLWPLILGFLLKRRSFKLAVATIAVLIIGSQALAAWYAADIGIDRAYYGTDSRMTGLLVGSLAAIYIPLHEIERYKKSITKTIRKTIGKTAWLLIAAVLLCMSTVGPASLWPFEGGFLVFDVLVIALALALIFDPYTLLARFTAGPLMVWLGTRSYGLYLWHWVIFQFTRPGTDTAIVGWRNTLLRLALTIAATEITYRMVETVIRRPERVAKPMKLRWAYGSVAAMLAVSLVFISKPGVLANQWPTYEALALERQRAGQLGGVPQAQIVDKSQPKPAVKPKPKEDNKPKRPQGLITVIGDSVVLGAAKSITAAVGKPLVLDAKVSRFPGDLPKEIENLEKEDKLGLTVVISIGTNGLVTSSDINSIMALLEGRQAVWVTPRGDKTWIRDSINNIRKQIPNYDNAVLADWAKLSADKPKWFISDGIHLSETGSEALAKLMSDAVSQLL